MPTEHQYISSVVHFVMLSEADWQSAGEHRPAIVVDVHDAINGLLGLNVFWKPGDTRYGNPYVVVPYSDSAEANTWHWPEPPPSP